MNIYELAIFLTKKCNLNCDYCYVCKQGNRSIKVKDLKKTLKNFLSSPPAEKVITFLGGEPLLAFDKLQKATELIKQLALEKGNQLEFGVVTNGKMLDARIRQFFRDNNFELTLSVDVPKVKNKNSNQGKYFTEEFYTLKDFFKDKIGLSVVFFEGNFKELFYNLSFFQKLGFAKIDFLPQAYVVWSRDNLKQLERIFNQIAKNYINSWHKNKRLFIIPRLKKYFKNSRFRGPLSCRKLLIDWDGNLASCFSFMTLSSEGKKNFCFQKNNIYQEMEQNFFGGLKMAQQKFLASEDILELRKMPFCPVDILNYTTYNKKVDTAGLYRTFLSFNQLYRNFFEQIISGLKDDKKFLRIYGK